ncbi:MAG: hypothetical protein E7454_06440 [Ruminococcaceae bacterium]|nr:hypothetical protein [Oscillospiraceae bacterium]
MLKINRIKAISRTDGGEYGFDYTLSAGLNLISSAENTKGKSSAILAIYYCLGLEEIIGGKGKKILTSVYKTVVEGKDKGTYNVLESEAWLEISNGSEVVTIKRAAEMINRNENLITVYHSNMDTAHDPKTYVEDMYVHSAHSTTSSKGFHAFLEKFIGFDLPNVPSNDGSEYKLYMQLLFSGMFIEQKRGWADLFSAMPVLGIKDAKKRVVEYILGLDTLSNERKRASLKTQEAEITHQWNLLISEISALCTHENCKVHNLSMKPCILDEQDIAKVCVTVIESGNPVIQDKLNELETRLLQLTQKTPKIVENFDELQAELDTTEKAIASLSNELATNRQALIIENDVISKLEANLQAISIDLQNNKDAQKLKKMGSDLDVSSFTGKCPVCEQAIQDSLLPIQNSTPLMSIEDNIHHLESQRAMVSFALTAHKKNRDTYDGNIQALSGRLFTLRRLAKSIRSDLYSVDDGLSETVVYERINIENRIQTLKQLINAVDSRLALLKELSGNWAKYVADKQTLPRTNFTDSDSHKVHVLETNFKHYLRAFNYKSVSSYDTIQISKENYLPTSEGFDMKFDSSASDNIRAIWAYTLALLRTSNEVGGNHPQIVMFDEPGQHSIVTHDMVSLFSEMIGMAGINQVILGITLNDTEICKAVEEIKKKNVRIIDVGEHAFQKF